MPEETSFPAAEIIQLAQEAWAEIPIGVKEIVAALIVAKIIEGRSATLAESCDSSMSADLS